MISSYWHPVILPGIAKPVKVSKEAFKPLLALAERMKRGGILFVFQIEDYVLPADEGVTEMYLKFHFDRGDIEVTRIKLG